MNYVRGEAPSNDCQPRSQQAIVVIGIVAPPGEYVRASL